MKFLIDNNLSPALADLLNATGHNATHLRSYGMQAALDRKCWPKHASKAKC